MSGNARDPGVIVLTLIHLFKQIEAIQARQEYVYKVSLCLLEVYNENVTTHTSHAYPVCVGSSQVDPTRVSLLTHSLPLCFLFQPSRFVIF